MKKQSMNSLNFEEVAFKTQVPAMLAMVMSGMLIFFFINADANTNDDTPSNVHYDRAFEIQQSALQQSASLSKFTPPEKELVDEGIRELEKSIELYPEFIKSYELLAFYYQDFVLYQEPNQSRIGEVKGIIEQLNEKAAQLDPDDPKRAMKIFHLKKRSDPERETIIREIIDTYPDYTLAYLHYAHYLRYTRQNQKAIDLYQKYIQMQYEQTKQPRSDAIGELWKLLTKQQRKSEAVNLLIKYTESGVSREKLTSIFNRLDITQYPKNQYPELHSKVKQIESFEDFSNIDQAQKFLQDDLLAKAMESYDRQIEVNPYGAHAIRSFAESLNKQGHYREAYNVYEKLIDSDIQLISKCAKFKKMEIHIDYLKPASQLPEKLVKLCNTWVTLVE
ncbi:MAG: hypothetical protein GY820_47790 [Gammaproteobacteria bacterium]|nr:hypothetical protein [Gammaproteobacteria bacterium]